MRALFSYGVAFLILVLGGAWLATGSVVMGGNGPGNGERPIISVIEGEVAPHGKYPEHSAALLPIAKRILALPHVEIASPGVHDLERPLQRSGHGGCFAGG